MPKNMLNAATDAFWFSRGRAIQQQSRWSNDDADPLAFARQLSAEAFAAGARWNMRETTRLNPYVSQFIEMLILLGVFDNAEMASAESAATSGTETTGTATSSQGEHDDSDMPAMSDTIFVFDASTWHGA